MGCLFFVSIQVTGDCLSRSRTIEEAEAYLEGLINIERRPDFAYTRLGLDPIRALLRDLGNPEHSLSLLHLAGSKGKGSTALLAEALILALGETAATFTSPHLSRWTERFRIGGRDVQPERLAAAVDRLSPSVDRLCAEGDTVPSFFDATTAAAFLTTRG